MALLHIFSTIKETKDYLENLKKQGKTIGLVPTMGALHPGHISLLERANKENDISVLSIFVNPLQFNEKSDLDKYPRTIEKDIDKLIPAQCNVLFAPNSEEMYPRVTGGKEIQNPLINLGQLDTVMEGLHRPGHFQGVCTVVKKLFDIIEPTKAFFGEKDFQQLTIIKYMVKILGIPVGIISCPIVRETDGLAMSSRNVLLKTEERKNASQIYAVLSSVKEKRKNSSISDVKNWVEIQINKTPFLKLEYFEVVNSETLSPVYTWDEAKQLRACIAVKVGAVRLIDNIAI